MHVDGPFRLRDHQEPVLAEAAVVAAAIGTVAVINVVAEHSRTQTQ